MGESLEFIVIHVEAFFNGTAGFCLSLDILSTFGFVGWVGGCFTLVLGTACRLHGGMAGFVEGAGLDVEEVLPPAPVLGGLTFGGGGRAGDVPRLGGFCLGGGGLTGACFTPAAVVETSTGLDIVGLLSLLLLERGVELDPA